MEPRKITRNRPVDIELDDLLNPSPLSRPPPARATEKKFSLAAIMAADNPPENHHTHTTSPLAVSGQQIEVGGPFVRTKPPLSRESTVRDDDDDDYEDVVEDGRRVRRRTHSQRSPRSPTGTHSHSNSRDRHKRRSGSSGGHYDDDRDNYEKRRNRSHSRSHSRESSKFFHREFKNSILYNFYFLDFCKINGSL